MKIEPVEKYISIQVVFIHAKKRKILLVRRSRVCNLFNFKMFQKIPLSDCFQVNELGLTPKLW